ncbi:MAG TPA: RDD family protein [Tepidiformaceae bacterium]|nr:RDD family protein [Tepidiformaceae bacterium]
MEPECRTFWQRVGAALIDGCVLSPATFPALLAIGYGPAWLAYLGILILVPVPLAYTTYCHGRWGQTLGKHATGIRVVRSDTLEPIGFGRALRRDAGAIVFSALCAAGMVAVVRSGETDAFRLFDTPEYMAYEPGEQPGFGEFFRESLGRGYPNMYSVFISIVNSIWGVAELVTMLLNSRRRALHDFIGGTVVIKVSPAAATPASPVAAAPSPPLDVHRLMMIDGPTPRSPEKPRNPGTG